MHGIMNISPPGLLAAEAPATWTDDVGTVRRTPTIRGRLKCGKILSHAALRDFILRRDRSCRWCGSQERMVADHIISRRNGGAHHPANLQALCESCNAAKVGLVDARARG
jgi:5-methylcytosine-specific restriction endonuclease McrA